MLKKIGSTLLLVAAFGFVTPAIAQPADYDARTTDTDDSNDGLWGLLGLLGGFGLLGLRRRSEETRQARTPSMTNPATGLR